jgi:hypothetical protein
VSVRSILTSTFPSLREGPLYAKVEPHKTPFKECVLIFQDFLFFKMAAGSWK